MKINCNQYYAILLTSSVWSNAVHTIVRPNTLHTTANTQISHVPFVPIYILPLVFSYSLLDVRSIEIFHLRFFLSHEWDKTHIKEPLIPRLETCLGTIKILIDVRDLFLFSEIHYSLFFVVTIWYRDEKGSIISTSYSWIFGNGL